MAHIVLLLLGKLRRGLYSYVPACMVFACCAWQTCVGNSSHSRIHASDAAWVTGVHEGNILVMATYWLWQHISYGNILVIPLIAEYMPLMQLG